MRFRVFINSQIRSECNRQTLYADSLSPVAQERSRCALRPNRAGLSQMGWEAYEDGFGFQTFVSETTRGCWCDGDLGASLGRSEFSGRTLTGRERTTIFGAE